MLLSMFAAADKVMPDSDFRLLTGLPVLLYTGGSQVAIHRHRNRNQLKHQLEKLTELRG